MRSFTPFLPLLIGVLSEMIINRPVQWVRTFIVRHLCLRAKQVNKGKNYLLEVEGCLLINILNPLCNPLFLKNQHLLCQSTILNVHLHMKVPHFFASCKPTWTILNLIPFELSSWAGTLWTNFDYSFHWSFSDQN